MMGGPRLKLLVFKSFVFGIAVVLILTLFHLSGFSIFRKIPHPLQPHPRVLRPDLPNRILEGPANPDSRNFSENGGVEPVPGEGEEATFNLTKLDDVGYKAINESLYPAGIPADSHKEEAPKIEQPTPGCLSIRRKGYSDWFDARYNSKIRPVWSRDNDGLTPDVFKWWRKLQGSPEVDMKAIMNQLYNLTGGPDHDPYQVDPNKCVRCAVVGNSGNLRNSKYGPEIDGHHYVMRINEAPVSGYERDVGRRTTHRFQYPESSSNIPDQTHLVLVPFKPLDIQWMISALTTKHITRTWTRVKSTIRVNRTKILVYHPAFFKYVRDRWVEGHGRYPSTGALVILFAIHSCDQVDVYGFGPDKRGNWDHYWSTSYAGNAHQRTRVHDQNFEIKLLNMLQKESVVSIHKPH